MSTRLLLMSDVHTRYDVINAQVAHAESEAGGEVGQVIVLGDFGFFREDLHAHFRRRGHRFLRPVATLDGNHEDHAALPRLAAQYADVVTYLPRGSRQQWYRWRALCLGGTRYMDAASTPRGSEITEQDLARCRLQKPGEIDLVLSHDCPSGLGVPGQPGLSHYGAPGSEALAGLAEHLRPRWWFFGHHHRWFDQERDGTRYVGLPESWCGYAMLDEQGKLSCVDHAVSRPARSWWRRGLGLD